MHTCVSPYQGVRNMSFSEYFAKILNEWSLINQMLSFIWESQIIETLEQLQYLITDTKSNIIYRKCRQFVSEILISDKLEQSRNTKI